MMIWFKDGNILGTGESGLPFYDPNIQYNINKDAWAYYALGHPLNIGSAATPTYWLLSKIQNMHIPGFIIQAAFLWLIFVISGFAIYKLVNELFPDNDKFYSLLSVLFYWFNPFSIVNVWNRFLNNFFFFYALLPLSIFLLIKGFKTKRYIYAILIGLVSAVLSYALTSIAFDFMLWVTLFYFGIFYFLTHKQDRLFIIKFLLLTILFWLLANFWWISQVFSYLALGSFNSVTSTSFNTDINYNTFLQISQRLGLLTYIFRLKHSTFFENIEQIEWIGIYQFPILVFFEFFISSMILISLILRKKDTYTLMIGGIFLISIFLAKGNNPPLGEIFDKAFKYFSFLQLFRNPFEKIGFILSLSASLLFAVGSFEIQRFILPKWRKFFYSGLFFWIVFIWGLPFWSNHVFTSTEPPANKVEVGYKVKVPTFYKKASEWLSSPKDNFRLIVFPLGKEGITYLWEKGYSGVELSNQILPKSSISFNTNIPFYDQISNDMERIFLTRENLSKILNVLNSKYVLLRSDIDWKIRKMRNPATIDDRLKKVSSDNSLIHVKDFSSLSFWEYKDWKDRSIYLTQNLTKSIQTFSIEDLLNVETDQQSVLLNSDATDDYLVKSQIIHPGYKFGLGGKSIEESIILRDDIIFPAVNILPSASLYPLILVKEKLESSGIADQNYKIIKRISLLGKRLVEADRETTLSRFDGAIKALNNYDKQLNDLYDYTLVDHFNKKDAVFGQEDLYKLFSRHLEVLDRLLPVFPEDIKEQIIRVQKLIKEFIINKGIKPIFGYLENINYPLKDRLVCQFTIEKEGSYELLFDLRNWNDYFKQSFEDPFLFQVDGKLVSRSGKLKNNNELISFGYFNLAPGKHEFGWNAPEAINLIDTQSEFLMKVDHGVFENSFPIKAFNPHFNYVVSINYLIKKGNGLQVNIEGNNDPTEKGITKRQFSKDLNPDIYNFELRKYTAYYYPQTTSDTANLILSVFPWNNCEKIYWDRGKERCKDEKFRRPYERTTEVSISDISLVKIMTEVPFLRLEEKNYYKEELPEITFEKINSAGYKVKIRKATDKYALILSELYDPAWKIFTNDGFEVTKKHFLANAYANGWIIDKKGDYELTIKFTPQDLLSQSKIVSAFSLLAGVIILYICIIKVKK